MKRRLRLIQNSLEEENDPAKKRRAKLILQNLGIESGMKILDVGCGIGFYEKTVSYCFSNVEIIGIDVSKKDLQKAKKMVNSRRDSFGISFVLADAVKLPFLVENFDRVICSEVLEHVKEDEEVMSQIYGVLKKAGKAIFTVPNKNYPFLWDPLNFILERAFDTHVPSNIRWLAGIWIDHIRLYTKDELIRKLEKTGLDVENFWFSTHYCFPFSHFLLFEEARNLVPFRIFDQFNNDNTEGKRAVNLVVKLRKTRAHTCQR